MKHGFIKIASAAPQMRLGDPMYNAARIAETAAQAAKQGVKLLVTPELSLTGYSCGDLFFQKPLLNASEQALGLLMEQTRSLKLLLAVGLPVRHLGKLYNCAAMLYQGEILGVVPKSNLPNYGEYSELRWFAPAPCGESTLEICGKLTVFCAGMLFRCEELPDFTVGLEICEDLWVPVPPSVAMCRNGATVIGCLCAEHDAAGFSAQRRALVRANSSRCRCAYLLSNAGEGESSTDAIFSGEQLIAENGVLLSAVDPFESGIAVTEADVEQLQAERIRINTYSSGADPVATVMGFSMTLTETVLTRPIPRDPWLPAPEAEKADLCRDIFLMQSHALARRLGHIHSDTAVIGVSGGLDSTLALLVAHKAMALLGKNADAVIAVTMPCFGTTARTKSNAELLCQQLGMQCRCVNIKDAVNRHFADIGHDPELHNVAFENAQARERTQVLMDLSNDVNGIVIGTGDFSELALGWATYNGDHMSMYGVNAGVPKTQIRQIVRWYAQTCGNETLQAILLDILDTPISPELLPAKEGQIAQKTEDLVGPYELHDFFLFYLLKYGFSPEKIFRMACCAFAGEYDEQTVRHWILNCYRRFFTQQYKRSCMPDGPMVGPLSLSPRGGWKMPSDSFRTPWQEALDRI